MAYKKVYLKPGKEESLKRFHPWVFSGAIHHIEGEPEEGEIVDVYTSKKNLLLADISKSEVLPCVCLPLDRKKLIMIFGNIVWK